jgi:hypothetical protein
MGVSEEMRKKEAGRKGVKYEAWVKQNPSVYRYSSMVIVKHATVRDLQ